MPRHIYEADHEDFRSSAREFVDRVLVPRAEDMRAKHEIPREVWREAGKQGFLGLCIPEEYGGAGIYDYRFNAVLTEEVARVSAGINASFGIDSDICPPYIVTMGTQEQKQRWLPPIAAGEAIIGIGMTEPSGGSDLAALKTTAVRDGDGWVINGSKTFITNGFDADLVIVAARTDPEAKPARGISLFMLEAGMPGFTKGAKLDKVGMDESGTCELFFSDVRVGPENLLGPLNEGFIAMMQHLPQERIGSAVANIHHAGWILQETIQYAKERKAFGQAIGSMQHNKFKIAELQTKFEVTRAYVDECVIAHSRGELSASDAAKAKWWSSDIQGQILDDCVQLHGGYGFMNEYAVARAWRDARVTRIWAGSNEIMKELIGRDLGL